MLRRTLPILMLALLVALPVLAGERENALREAATAGDIDSVKKLLAEGLDVDAPVNDYGSTALTFAAGGGHLELVRFLVEKGADVNVTDTFYQFTPVTNAVFEDRAEVAAHLVEHGADAFGAARASLFGGKTEVMKAVLGTGKLSAEQLTQLLQMAKSRTDAEEAVTALGAAGAKPPPPSQLKLSPEALAPFTGRFLLSQLGIELSFTVEEGVLTVRNHANDPPEPAALEPLEATRFRSTGSGSEYAFELEGENVTGFKLFSLGRDEPYQFVRQEEAPAGADAQAEAPAVAETPTEAEAAVPAKTVIPPGAAGRDWPAFRGPNAAGTAQGDPPFAFNAAEGKNVRWKTAIPGRAHSSPIVWGDRLFVTTAVAEKGEGEFRHGLYGDIDEAEINSAYSWQVYALDARSGEVLWHRVAAEGMPRAARHTKATQANSTPATDGKHLVTTLGSEGLYCYDLDGKLLWKKDLGRLDVGWFYDSSILWGHSSSPILYKDMVILQVDRGSDPFIAAYALADGRELWRTARENLPSWGTPTLLEGEGGVELITNGSRFIRAYDPMTGQERWSLGPHSEVTVGTPVVGHGLVFVTGGYPPVRPVYAVRPGGEGDISLAEGAASSEHVAWSHDRDGTYIPTPIVYGDQLYTLSNSGVLISYDARSGERLYRERAAGRGGVAFSASPVAAAGRLYLTSEEGDVYVVKAGKEFELLATSSLGEIVMATPAISGDMLYFRSLQHLFAIGEAPEEGEGAASSP